MTPRVPRVPRFAALAGLGSAALVAIASIAGLGDPAIYARETPAWRLQGLAQDGVDLAVATPWLIVASLLTLRGSRRGVLLLGGGLLYTAYTFVIYAFAIRFNAMFLVYVATLGLSCYGLVDLARALDGVAVRGWFDGRVHRIAGVVLIVVAIAFAALWLSEVVPALVRGVPPASLAEVGLATNPVHVLDLAIVLPLLLIGGRRLYRGDDAGFALGALLLGFGALMALAIAVIVVVQLQHGAGGDVGVAVVLAAMAAGLGGLLASLLRTAATRSDG